MQQPVFVRRFRFFGLLTVVSVYLLILVGGVVRSTGSGMGCPDWPKCFGSWVPPTQLSQLPPNYKEVYTAQRVAKNQKLARTLARLGFREVAGEIFAHPTQYIETDFNATKTWIEYINRLLGALIGVFIFLAVVLALPYWRRDRPVFWLTLLSFVLTGVQGWLGSLVVSTNLLPIMVTIHMGLALVIVALLLYAVDRAGQGEQVAETTEPGLGWLLGLAVLATFGQIVLGTQVREEVDVVAAAANHLGRADWVAQLGSSFRIHRTFSAVLLLLNAFILFRLYMGSSGGLRRLALAIAAAVGLEILAGITLAGWALPAAVQPVHLTLATVLFGLQFLAVLAYRRATKLPRQEASPGVVA